MTLRSQLDDITNLLGLLAGPLCEQADGFTCTEAEYLAALYRAVGRDDDADDLLDAHSLGDEKGDRHHGRLAAVPDLKDALSG